MITNALTRWIVSRSIDPDVPMTREEQDACVREAAKEFYRDLRFPLRALIVLPALLFVIIYPRFFGYSLLNAFIAGLGSGVLIALTFAIISIPMMRKRLREKVRARGFDVCIHCGYYLHGLDPSIDQCPECGWNRTGTPAP